MRHSNLLLTLAGLVAFAATAAHAAPVEGTYTSADVGGAMFRGRASQSWAAASNANQGVNDVFNAQSWDGSALGTQWGFSCSVQSGQQMVQDNRESGFGTVVYTNTFQGGVFILNPGPWGSGTGTIGPTSMTYVVTWTYIDFFVTGVRADLSLSGDFDDSMCVLTLTSLGSNVLGNTDFVPFPANFPGLLDPACIPNRMYGGWGEVSNMRMEISCPVSTEAELWGRVKAIYR